VVGVWGRGGFTDAWNQRREYPRHILARARSGLAAQNTLLSLDQGGSLLSAVAHRHHCRLPPERYYPGFKAIYDELGWSLDHIDRVYDSSLALQKLGWKPGVDFGTILSGLKSGASQVEWNPADRRVNSYNKP
jgi:hypothetical protein